MIRPRRHSSLREAGAHWCQASAATERNGHNWRGMMPWKAPWKPTNHPTYLTFLPHQSKASRFTITSQNWLNALSKLALSSGSQTSTGQWAQGSWHFLSLRKIYKCLLSISLGGTKLNFAYGFHRPQSSSVPKTNGN